MTRESGITIIAFNRPEKRNAMSPQLHNEMFELLTELRYNSLEPLEFWGVHNFRDAIAPDGGALLG